MLLNSVFLLWLHFLIAMGLQKPRCPSRCIDEAILIDDLVGIFDFILKSSKSHLTR